MSKQAGEEGQLAFVLYCIFIVSYFLHLGNRISLLGTLRIDIVLSGLTLILVLTGAKQAGSSRHGEKTAKLLVALCVYIVLTLPFVKWPGSVLGKGWEPFLKSACFFYFTTATVTSERRLKVFLWVFISVQMFRVLEPLYLHITTGYWGSFTNMGNYELMDRLSGAPFDIVNANGLAFIILVVISLIHSLLSRGSALAKLLYVALMAPLLYAMSLTGSRSGVLVLYVFALMAIWQSKHRAIALTIVGVVTVGIFASLSDLEQQRYISIVDRSAKGGETANGRVDGIWTDFMVGMEQPIFGHGLGTSLEANANAYGEALPSHTLYTEVLQELGICGLLIFLAFILSTCKNCLVALKSLSGSRSTFMYDATSGLRDLAVLLVIFSVASYGLNEYQWYLLAGLSVVLCRIAADASAERSSAGPLPLQRQGGTRRSVRKGLTYPHAL